MAKYLVVLLCAALSGVLAEPPVPSYLPPQARASAPSARYGAPAVGGSAFGGRGATSFHSQRTGSQSFSYNAQHGSTGVSQFRNAGHGTFGGRSSFAAGSRASQGFAAPAQQYAAPAPTYSAPAPSFAAPAPTYSAPAQSFAAPSPTYGAPSVARQGFNSGAQQGFASNFASQSSSFSAGHGSFAGAAGHGSFGSSQGSFGGRAASFGASAAHGAANSFRGFDQGFAAAPTPTYSAPAQQYAAPAPQYSAPAQQYGPPSSRYGAPFAKKMDDDDLAEPANYEYNYQVLAAEDSGAEFGHQESRENEAAKGEYRVLLPDGRMQIVEYEADEEGYRPNIRYEETNTGYPAARSNGGYTGLQGPY